MGEKYIGGYPWTMTDTNQMTESGCPICFDRSTSAEPPARDFCDEHYRQYLLTFNIAPKDLAEYRAKQLASSPVTGDASPLPLSGGWQPIETVAVGWENIVDLWVTYTNRTAERLPHCRASVANGKADWHYQDDEYGWKRIDGTPTHWMSLPEPPSRSRDDGEAPGHEGPVKQVGVDLAAFVARAKADTPVATPLGDTGELSARLRNDEVRQTFETGPDPLCVEAADALDERDATITRLEAEITALREPVVTEEMCQAGRQMPGAWGYSDELVRDIYLAMQRVAPKVVG